MARKMPTARAGNYAAPVDTSGMDPEMKETLGVGRKKISGVKSGSSSTAKKPSLLSRVKKAFTGKY